MRLILILTSLIALTACTTLQRSLRSGYAHRPGFGGETDRGLNPRQERDAREELCYGERPLTREEERALALRTRIKDAEERLPNRRERRQYYQMRGNLRDDRERLAVLQLPDVNARSKYARARHLNADDDRRSDEVAAAIEAKDIALGMSQKAVGESWGDPDLVENSGNPDYGIERWRYTRYVSGGEGYRKEMRTVYFESGRVTGWERN